jgi:hypothetical protein
MAPVCGFLARIRDESSQREVYREKGRGVAERKREVIPGCFLLVIVFIKFRQGRAGYEYGFTDRSDGTDRVDPLQTHSRSLPSQGAQITSFFTLGTFVHWDRFLLTMSRIPSTTARPNRSLSSPSLSLSVRWSPYTTYRFREGRPTGVYRDQRVLVYRSTDLGSRWGLGLGRVGEGDGRVLW